MKTLSRKPKAGSAKRHAVFVPETGTGKDRANTAPIGERFEIYFDGDRDTWYRYDSVTKDMKACLNRHDCEVEVAIANLDAARAVRNAQKQLRLVP